MKFSKAQIKNAMLPIAMIGGAVFYPWMGALTFLSPYLIFCMLFITYCKLDIRDFKPQKEHLMLLAGQMLLSAIIYFAISPFNHLVGEGIFICVFIPTATAAPVITSMLGGSISFVATYSLLCNGLVAVIGPVVLAAIGDHPDMSLWQSTMLICSKVFPLLILPLALALILRYCVPKVHAQIVERQEISLYLWACSLFIIMGSCISFAIRTWEMSRLWSIVMLIGGALGVCLFQFYVGRKIGRIFGDKVSGGQSFGQKNTVLAIWIALTYLNPISSIAPAAYVVWQNIVNSWQLMRHNSRVPSPPQP